MKIMYVHTGLINEDKSDHRSYEHYSDNSENEAWKKGCTLFYSTQKGESIDHLTDLGLQIGLVEMKCN